MNRHFVEMLRALSDAGAEHLVIGAHAVAAHGHLRATEDFDIFIRPTTDNAERVIDAINRFGAPSRDLTIEDLATAGIFFQIGVRPFRIDLINDIPGVTFEEAWNSRLEIEIDELMIPFIGKDALIKNKRATGRPQDLLDAEALERT
ncbi:MAG TPA: hypothetical protein VHL58_14155 [Thermoanaerobaculia bacterium]|nr:hypothetical protein [Thermoanaerobaculia bacterium]